MPCLKVTLSIRHTSFPRGHIFRGLRRERKGLNPPKAPRHRHCCVTNKWDSAFHPAQKTGTPGLKGNASLTGGPLGTTWQPGSQGAGAHPGSWAGPAESQRTQLQPISSADVACLPQWRALPLSVSRRDFSGLLCVFQMPASLANPGGNGTRCLSVWSWGPGWELSAPDGDSMDGDI